MNILDYKRSNRVCFDNLVYGDLFILNDKVYMKVKSEIRNNLKEKSVTQIYYNINCMDDFCVDLETGEPMTISGGRYVEPLGEVKIKKDDKWHIN